MKHTSINTTQQKKFSRFFLPTTSYYSGFTLFYAMLISSLLLSIGLAIFNITYKEFILTSSIRESEGAFYAADSALECALYWDFVHEGSATPAFGFFGDSLASGLMGYWRFEETAEYLDLALDSSGQDNTGSLFGDPVRVGGTIGNALQFDGVDDYFNAESVISFGALKEHSISAWINVTSLPIGKGQSAGVLLLGGESAGSHEWILGDDGSLTIQEIGGAWSLNSGALEAGWNHIVVTYDDLGGLLAYANNNVFGTESAGLFTSLSGTQPLTLGLNFSGSDVFFNGELDDVRVYDYALSAKMVEALNTGESANTFVGPVDPMVDDGGIQITCSGAIINDPSTGWNVDPNDGETLIGWTITPEDPVGDRQAQTVFDISFEEDGTCALVTVSKSVDVNDVSATTIISRGYNTCDLTNPRRLERAIRAIY